MWESLIGEPWLHQAQKCSVHGINAGAHLCAVFVVGFSRWLHRRSPISLHKYESVSGESTDHTSELDQFWEPNFRQSHVSGEYSQWFMPWFRWVPDQFWSILWVLWVPQSLPYSSTKNWISLARRSRGRKRRRPWAFSSGRLRWSGRCWWTWQTGWWPHRRVPVHMWRSAECAYL